MELAQLKYPNMRRELIEYLDLLQESKYSMALEDFDYVVHFFFDDTSLSRDANMSIGYFLINAEEGDAIRRLIDAIDRFIGDGDDSTYVFDSRRSKQWSSVIESANEARSIVQRNGVVT